MRVPVVDMRDIDKKYAWQIFLDDARKMAYG